MRTETYTLNIYEYDELSEKAKEKVKEMFAEWQGDETDIFTDDCNYQISEKFPNSNLDVQYDLGYSQGDGLNIYGELDLNDALNDLKDNFTAEEVEIIKYIFDYCGFDTYDMPENRQYCYCICGRLDYMEEAEIEPDNPYDEDETMISDFKTEFPQYFKADNFKDNATVYMNLVDKFQSLIGEYMVHLCNQLEKQGYDFFYPEYTDEDAREMCEDNGYEFYEDGSLA